jgi:predicted MFS family arabinose efflux permease
LLGNLAVGRLVRPAMRERLVAPILIVFGLPMIALAFPLSLWVTACLLFVVGAGFSYSLGVQRAFLDALDPKLRGQAFALQFTGLMTLQGVGPLVSGAVADLTRTSVSMALMGLGTVLVGVRWWQRRTARHPSS